MIFEILRVIIPPVLLGLLLPLPLARFSPTHFLPFSYTPVRNEIPSAIDTSLLQ
jgi:hypothetical protein